MSISRWLLLALLVSISVSGCTSWGREPTPRPSPAHQLPRPVRVTLTDQRVLTLREAMVYGDSLVGYEGPDALPTTVALADVRTMQARKKDHPRTRILAVGLTVGAVLLLPPPGGGAGHRGRLSGGLCARCTETAISLSPSLSHSPERYERW